jgi:PAS domain S-box-containing protein
MQRLATLGRQAKRVVAMKRGLALRTRLIAVVLAAFLPLFVLSLVGVALNTKEAVSQAKTNLALSASLVAANQQKTADATRQILTAIANTPGLLDAEGPACERYFKTLHDQLGIYTNLGIIGVNGQLRCDSVLGNPVVFAGDRQYFRDAVASGTFVNSGYLVGRATGKPIMNFAMPMLDGEGKTRAVAFAAMPLSALVKISDAPLPRGSRLVIADRFGIVLATSPQDPAAIGKPLRSQLLLDALKAGVEGVRDGLDESGTRQISVFQPSAKSPNAPFFVAISADWSQVVAPVYQQHLLLLLALILVALFGSWLAWRMGGRAIVLPAARILDATRQLEQGQLDVRVAMDTFAPGGEFFLIADSFNRMAEALQRREDDLKIELGFTQRAQLALEDAQRVQAKSYIDLHRSQHKLLQAQRLGRMGHWELDIASQHLTLSGELQQLLGTQPGTFDGSHEAYRQTIHPGDRDHYAKQLDAAQSHDKPLDIEYRVIAPDGAVRWMNQQGSMQSDADGHPLLLSGLLQEITTRKQSELALLKVTEHLQLTGEMASVGGWELDLESMQLTWSEQTFRIHDLDPAGGVDLSKAIEFYAPEARPVINAAVQRAVEHGTPWNIELPLVTATGRKIWVRAQGQATQQAGKVVRLTGAFQDITEQRQAQDQMRLLQTCVANLNDILMITEVGPTDAPGPRIIFVNDAFERLTGYSREEVLNKSPSLLQGPKTQRAELDRIDATLKKWQSVRAELIHYTKSGHEFWIEIDIIPIANSSGWFTHWVTVARDITKRKLAEQALMESEHRYTALFETAPVPMWVVDVHTERFLIVNSAATEAYGYSNDELLSMTLLDIRPASEHERLRRELTDAVVGSERKGIWLHRRKDGSLFPVIIFAKSIQYAGKAMRFVVALDVTGQVKAEKEIQEHLFTLQRAADAAQAITWHQTLEGTLQEVADQARGVIGANQAVVSLAVDSDASPAITAVSLSDKHAPHLELIKAADGLANYAMMSPSNRSVRMTQAELEAHPRWRGYRAEAGKPSTLRGWLAVPLMSRSGKYIGLLQLSDKYEGEFTLQDEYVAIELAQLASIALQNAQLIREVSQLNAGLERKVAERTVALARQEALFRALAEQAPQVVWTSDPRGRITYVNNAWFDLVGGDLQDWSGMQWFGVMHPEDLPGMRANWEVAVASGSPYVGIRRVRAKNGVYRTMSYRASPVLDSHGEVSFWVGIDADITEMKTVEAALRLSNQELEAFSYSVSHDLRSPLNTIDGFSRLLSKQVGSDAHLKAQHYLSRIQAGVAQMGRLIEDLLSLSQVARMELRYEEIDMSALSHRIVEDWRGRQPERQVTIHIEDGLKVQCDGRLVRVLMENLLGNAWKFTSREADASIDVGQTLDAAGQSEFFVRDNGVGFDMAYADKLFVAFQRLHAVSEFPGTGIGLATVSRVVSRQGGRIRTESALGQGATFFFTLPPMARSVQVAE